MTRLSKFLVGLVVVPTVLTLLAYYVWPQGRGITDRLASRAQQILADEGFSWVNVTLDPESGARYRVASLSGPAPTADALDKARDLLLERMGGVGLSGGLHAVRIPEASPAGGITPYVWKLQRQGDGSFVISGYVPSEAIRSQVMTYATRRLAPAGVVDRMTVGAGVPDGDWQATVRKGIDYVADLGNDSAEMINSELTVIGRTPDMGLRERILSEMANNLPKGYLGRAVIEIGEGPLPPAAEAPAAATAPAPAPEAGAEPAPAAPDPVVDRCQQQIDAVMANQVIEFDVAQATLRDDPNPLLDRLAQVLQACPGTEVRVAGHTDSDGSTASNQRLSEARAQTVTAYLIRRGIAQERLTSIGFGETRPLMPGDDAASKQRNRRIEFSVSRADSD